jgi:hypothetical protein
MQWVVSLRESNPMHPYCFVEQLFIVWGHFCQGKLDFADLLGIVAIAYRNKKSVKSPNAAKIESFLTPK